MLVFVAWPKHGHSPKENARSSWENPRVSFRQVKHSPGLTYLRRANDAYDRKEWDSALTNYNRTIELAPQHAYGYLGRGNVKKVQGDLDGALADYEK